MTVGKKRKNKQTPEQDSRSGEQGHLGTRGHGESIAIRLDNGVAAAHRHGRVVLLPTRPLLTGPTARELVVHRQHWDRDDDGAHLSALVLHQLDPESARRGDVSVLPYT